MTDVSGQEAVVREVLPEVAARFADLITRAPAPGAPATADWTVADTAAHVTAIAVRYAEMLAPDGGEVRRAVADQVAEVTVDTVAEMNNRTLGQFTERDPAVLAATLRSAAGTVVDLAANADLRQPVPWLGNSRVPLGGVLAHLVNEMLVHGWDIARATRTPWPIAPREAAPFFDLFVVGMIRNDVGRLLDGPPPDDRRIAVAFRSRHTAPVTLVLHHGRVRVQEADDPADARVSFDPSTLNLVLFGRVSRARAVLTGRLRVTGRRPWLLPAFLRTVRLPTNAAPLPSG
ncbi:maleylpyruvate isomerase N-terminal domain-containing protein [Actinosynnema sp. NPDC023587]|uniref:maleylpyruvate isomerase N-terminal domain-containing protein n=1 Tax=Actinosynnema sp. NPDC023587 TaxID=3154695 RepID=UPI0033C3CDDC